MKKTKKSDKSSSRKQNLQGTPPLNTPFYCSMVKIPERNFEPEVSAHRMKMIIMNQSKWVNGTKLKYYFFKGGSDGSPASWKGSTAQRDVVKKAFNKWKSLGIGLEFEEVHDKNEAMVKIGFLQDGSAWSYVGRDILKYAASPNERSMNFGWDLVSDPDTALHEIGHTLGAPHEHQNPNAGIVWDEEAVYNDLAGYPNYWSRLTTYENIINKLSLSEVEGSTHDPNSVMHYPFKAGLIKSPEEFKNGIQPAGGLSQKDIEFVKNSIHLWFLVIISN